MARRPSSFRSRNIKLQGGVQESVLIRDRHRVPGSPVEMVNYVPHPSGYRLTDGYAPFPAPGRVPRFGYGPILAIEQIPELGEVFVWRENAQFRGTLNVYRYDEAGAQWLIVPKEEGLESLALPHERVRTAVFRRATAIARFTEVYFVTGKGNEVRQGQLDPEDRRGLFRVFNDGTWKVGAVQIGTERQGPLSPVRIVQVQAGSSGGWSGTTTVRVAVEAPQPPLVFDITYTTSIALSAESTGATQYRFRWRLEEDTEEGGWTELLTGDYTITGLTAETTYVIDVQAGNTAGWSASQTLTVTTAGE